MLRDCGGTTTDKDAVAIIADLSANGGFGQVSRRPRHWDYALRPSTLTLRGNPLIETKARDSMAETIRRACTECPKRVAVYPNTGRLYPHGPGGSGCAGSGTQVIPPRPESTRSHCDHCGVTIFTSHVWDEAREAWVPTTSVRTSTSPKPILEMRAPVVAA